MVLLIRQYRIAYRDVFNVTHGHCYKLKKVHVSLDVRKHFLANRVVNVWNNLPNDVVLSSSVSMFAPKLRLCNLSSFIRGEPLYSIFYALPAPCICMILFVNALRIKSIQFNSIQL